MKHILAVVIMLSLNGCAISSSAILAYALGAVTVAENIAEVATIYKDTKDYIMDDSNATADR